MTDNSDELTAAYMAGLHDGRMSSQRKWVGLTREEVLDMEDATSHPLEFARAIEAKLREKNK